jgi:uncharacterized protein YdhG (YjbR/CyaY superfamily)
MFSSATSQSREAGRTLTALRSTWFCCSHCDRGPGDRTMTSRKEPPQGITEYINAAPRDAQKKLRQMRACIRAAAPGARESLKWGMPAFSYRRILVTFAAFKHHIGFYPTPSALRAFANDLSRFVTAKASIQFPLEKPLPLGLIRKITAFRVQQSIEEDGKWRT